VKRPIFTTTNYALFTELKGSRLHRPLSPEELDRFHADLDLPDGVAPILVTENMEIIEGWHRFAVAKEFDLPIGYSIVPRREIKILVQRLNRPVIKPLRWYERLWYRLVLKQGGA